MRKAHILAWMVGLAVASLACTSPPTLSSIDPGEGVAGFTLKTVRISGQNLTSGSILATGGITFADTVISDSEILTDIDLTNATEGNQLITVMTMAGMATIPFAVVEQEMAPAEAPNDLTSAALFINQPQNLLLPNLGPPSPEIQEMINELNSFWGLSVRVNTYTPGTDSGQGMTWPPNNAFSIPGPDQQIAYDAAWLAQIESQQGNDTFTQLVMAHEVGHQVQFQFIGRDNLPMIGGYIELMADCFAGIYLAKRGYTAEQINAAQSPLCGGASVWIDPNSHGSCEERMNATDHGVSINTSNPNADVADRIDVCKATPPFGDQQSGPGSDPVPPPQQTVFGCIFIQNYQQFPVQILLNNQFAGVLQPFQGAPIGNLPGGNYQITSIAPSGGFIVVPVTVQFSQQQGCSQVGV